MATISLSPELMDELEQAAEGQALKTEELVETAVRSYLRQLEREKIKREAVAFRAMHAQLVKQYLGQYVAVHKGEVIDHADELPLLHRRIRDRFGRQAVLIRQVTAEPERVIVMRSPRLEQPHS